ncbi:hypothetical protein HYU94_00715 [Candidatus Daviesbacteria bacterium]|nr:hypothetical protein [Candidatus Daviesbacteria bacterium]
MTKIFSKFLIIFLSLNLILTSVYPAFAYQADEEGNPVEEAVAEEAVTEPADVSQDPATDEVLPVETPQETPEPEYTPVLSDQEQFDQMMEQAVVQAELLSIQERQEAYERQQAESFDSAQDLAQGAVGGVDDLFDKSEETLRKTGEGLSETYASAYDQLLVRRQEEAEQKRLMEELGIVEQAAQKSQEQYQQEIQAAIDAPVEERIARMRESLGLAEGAVSDETVRNTFQQAAKDIGINVTMDGDIDNFTITLTPEEVDKQMRDTWIYGGAAVGATAALVTAPIWVPAAGAAATAVSTAGLTTYVYATSTGAVILANSPRIVQQGVGLLAQNADIIVPAATWAVCQGSDDPKSCVQDNLGPIPQITELAAGAKAATKFASQAEKDLDFAAESAMDLASAGKLSAIGTTTEKALNDEGWFTNFWQGTKELAADETGSFNLRNIFVRGSNTVNVTEDGTTVLSDSTFKRAADNRLKATEEDVIGKPIGHGSYGITFRKDDEVTKIFFPNTDVATQEVNLRQVDLLKKAEGKYGLPEFLGEVKNSKGELIGVKQEYIEGKSLRAFMQDQDEAPQKISLEAAQKFINDLMEAHTNLGVPHLDLTDGVHILMTKGDDPANPVFRMIDYGGVDFKNSWLLRGSTMNELMYKDVKETVSLFFRTNTVRSRSPVKTIVNITDDEAERVANEILATAKEKYLSSKGAVKGISTVNVGGADTNKDLPVASFQDIRMYELSAKKGLIKDALRKNGSIDSEYVQQVLMTDIIKPETREMNGGYEFVTGRAGTVEGEIEEGVYIVDVDALPDSDISIPKTITVTKGSDAAIPIKVKQGSGKVEKDQGAITTNKVSIAVMSDDGKEVLPWAGLSVTLTKAVQEKGINLNNGWNLVTLTALPAQAMTASTLISEIAKQGGYATTVSSLENGFWKSYVVRAGKTYSGEDFGIEPGKAYFVKSEKKSTFTFAGQNFVAPVKLKLASGWNAVGLPKTSKAYKAADLPVGSAARWESGLWDTLVKKQNENFGENFAIANNRGYLVKMEQGGEFSP